MQNGTFFIKTFLYVNTFLDKRWNVLERDKVALWIRAGEHVWQNKFLTQVAVWNANEKKMVCRIVAPCLRYIYSKRKTLQKFQAGLGNIEDVHIWKPLKT